MVDAILLNTQITAALTLVSLIIAYIISYSIVRHLVKDDFRKLVFGVSIFLLVAAIAAVSMTTYHISEGFETETTERVANIAFDIWEILAFIALIISCYVSVTMVTFGKKFGK